MANLAEVLRYMCPDGRGDYMRGWILAACLVGISVTESVVRAYSVDRTSPPCSLDSVYYLYYLVIRPWFILDFTLTLLFNHLVLTTYYSADLSTSLFF